MDMNRFVMLLRDEKGELYYDKTEKKLLRLSYIGGHEIYPWIICASMLLIFVISFAVHMFHPFSSAFSEIISEINNAVAYMMSKNSRAIPFCISVYSCIAASGCYFAALDEKALYTNLIKNGEEIKYFRISSDMLSQAKKNLKKDINILAAKFILFAISNAMFLIGNDLNGLVCTLVSTVSFLPSIAVFRPFLRLSFYNQIEKNL